MRLGLLCELMRRLFSIFMSCVFGLAFAQAPFAHVHEHSDPHDHGGVFHSHGKHHHDSDGPAIEGEDPDHDARSLDVFKIVKSPDSKLLFTLPTTLISFSLPVSKELVQAVPPRGHDPPALVSSPARAPPA
jgi:hypothetical protein